jgi:hypothetical protein
MSNRQAKKGKGSKRGKGKPESSGKEKVKAPSAPPKKESNTTPPTSQPAVLHRSGILKAYQELLRDLCRKGLPTGNVYEYAALQMLKAERVYKSKILKRDAVVRQ